LDLSVSDGKSILERTSIVHIEQGLLYRSALGICIALGVAELGVAARCVN
jgi:hypothetical protein